MQNTIQYIEDELARLDISEKNYTTNGNIDGAIRIMAIKSALNRVREVAESEKSAQDKLDFERRCESC